MIEHFISIEALTDFSRKNEIKVLNIFQTEEHCYRQVIRSTDIVSYDKSYVYTNNNYFLVFEYINEDKDEKN